MPQPFDYGIRAEVIPNPVEGFLGALQVVQKMQKQKAEEAQAQKRQQVMGRVAALGPNLSANDIWQASLELPDDAAMFKQGWEMMEKSSQDALFNAGKDAFMLAQSGETGKAKDSLEEWALGFENSGDKENAQKLRTAAKMMELHPETAKTTIGMMLAFADGERFKNVVQPSEATTFQKDFNFIKETFGDDAAAEYAQFGRDNIVSVPLGNGQTYVGPASSAPGASRWSAQGSAPSGPGVVSVPRAAPTSAVDIMDAAAKRGSITKAEFDTLTGFFGPAGKSALETWKAKNKVKIITRTGTDANGRRVVQYEDGTTGYAGDAGGNASGGFRD